MKNQYFRPLASKNLLKPVKNLLLFRYVYSHAPLVSRPPVGEPRALGRTQSPEAHPEPWGAPRALGRTQTWGAPRPPVGEPSNTYIDFRWFLYKNNFLIKIGVVINVFVGFCCFL